VCILKDVRKSLFVGFLTVCAYWIKFTGQKAVKLKFRSIFYDVLFAFKLIFSTGKIIKCRRKCKLLGAYL
jgi:hypothetical protein